MNPAAKISAGIAAADLKQKIEKAARAPVADIRPYGWGNNSRLYLADIRGGGRLVAKAGMSADARLDLEGWMLNYLRENSDLPVPGVLLAERGLLVMEWLPDSGPLDARAEEHAADLLASLHSIRRMKYGLEQDTLIGPLPQPNAQGDDWAAFFRDRRLLHMARQALGRNIIDTRAMDAVEKLAAKLPDLIGKAAPPSLIHGDVWGGNVLSMQGRITGFIDPAIYYADPEIELAFATLFGTFGDSFFRRYNERNPIRPGFFETRRDIYNLYPLLVHACLFGGGGYASHALRIIRRFA